MAHFFQRSSPLPLLTVLIALSLSACTSTQHSSTQHNAVTQQALAMQYAVTSPTTPHPSLSTSPQNFPGSPLFAPSQNQTTDTTPPTLTASTLQWELLSQYQLRPQQVELNDSTYVIPSQLWLEKKFIPHAKTYFINNNLIGSGEGRDCDNISLAFRHLLVLANITAGGAAHGDVPCAILKTQQINPFGGIQGQDSYHTLILIRTDQGWHIIEPQTGQHCPFQEYPNKQTANWALL